MTEIDQWLLEHAPDCGDNSCLFGGRGKGGMRTNGGCRCFKDLPQMKRIYVERLFSALSKRHESAPTEVGTRDEWELNGRDRAALALFPLPWSITENGFILDANGRSVDVTACSEIIVPIINTTLFMNSVRQEEK